MSIIVSEPQYSPTESEEQKLVRRNSLESDRDSMYSGSGTMDLQAKLKMEDEKRLKSSAVRAFPWFLNLIIFLIQVGIFVGFAFFAYGTRAVHNDECYANADSNMPVNHGLSFQKPINVGQRFLRIIRFGFWIAILEIIRQILAQIAYYKQSYKILYPAFVLQALNCTFVIICFTFMQLFRWDHAGMVCSGDYLTDAQRTQVTNQQDKVNPICPTGSGLTSPCQYLLNEGLFLKIIVISVYTLIGMSCLSVCIIALCLSAKKTEEEIKNTKSAGQTPLTGDVY